MKLPLKFGALPTSGPLQRGNIRDANGQRIVADIDQESGDLIVTACNTQYQLVAALSELLRECRMHTGWPSDLSTYAKADAALTAAGAA